MNKEQVFKQENDALRAIAIQAKQLLLSDQIRDATPEVMDLCELVERYEEKYGEIPPLLKPLGQKPWYASFDEKKTTVKSALCKR